ncbi:MAG: xanthine dehydrogenase family protein molybdopterin-binding subunit [Candidatus Aminicenantes bacterium]|nr:xanthine dehydrogenase family protein molybdopterin-binding subunit [Candidatus Aminicenantes bacterium]
MSRFDLLDDPYLDYREHGKARPAAMTGSGATIPPEEPDAPDTSAAPFKIIGKYTKRIDGARIVTGQAKYTHDLYFDEMLHGRILRSPHAAAEVVSVDLSAAQAAPGVKAVLRLKEGRVRWAGESIAAVAAVSEEAAQEALALIKVEYKVLPHVVDDLESMRDGAPKVTDQPNIQPFAAMDRGDLAKGFAEAEVVIERAYRTNWEIHQPTETHGSVAKWDGDFLTVWDSTQAIQSVRDGLARALAVPAANVKVIKNYMGGGFGSKLSMGDYALAAARLAKETGCPVKIVLDRRENSTCVGYRPSTRFTVKIGARKDGLITALHVKNANCGGTGRGDRCGEPFSDVYKIPNLKIEESAVLVNACPSRATRAPGHTQATLALEGAMEELAAALGMDPLELRLKNYASKGDGETGLPYSLKRLDGCYKAGAEAIGWARRNKKPGGGTGRVRRGIGMASQIWPGAGTPGTLADLKLYPDGAVEIECGTQDLGCGTRTHIAVVAAETLGLEPTDITVKIGDSDYPWAPISGGSLTTPSVAPAVRDAALKAAEYLKQSVAKKLGAPPEEIVLAGRKLFVAAAPEKAIDFKEAVKTLRRPQPFHGERAGFPDDKFDFQTFGAHFCEVEVDTWTGRVRVIKHVAAHDIGRVINRQTAESQVIGGVAQGLSAALFEEKLMDAQTGATVNANLHDYKGATIRDIPEIVPIFIDEPDDRLNNLGCKGLGEPPRIPSSAAAANAVFNAIGVHVGEIPMTPGRVLAALKRKEARS